MPKRFYQIPMPTQGWSDAFDDYLSGRQLLSDVSNVRIDKGIFHCGVPMGTGPAIPSSAIANGAFFFLTGEGDTASLMGTANSLYRWSVATDAWEDIASALSFTGAASDLWSFGVNFDYCYASNAVDGIYRYNGTGGFSAYDTTRKARYLAGFAGRILCADVTTLSGSFRDRVIWSGLGATSTFETADGGGFNDLVDVPGPVTGMGSIGSSLYIYKANAIWRVDETGLELPAFRFQPFFQGAGAIGGRSLVRSPIGHLYLGSDLNVYRFDGSSQPQPIGDPVYPWLRDNFNEASVENVYGMINPRYHEYWLLVPSGSDTWSAQALVYNWRLNAWSRVDFATDVSVGDVLNRSEDADTWGGETVLEWDSETSKTWGSSLTNAIDPDLWLGVIDGTVDEPDFDGYTGSSTWSFETSDDPLDRPGFDKTVTRVVMHGRFDANQTINVKLSTDGGDSWTTPVAQSITGDPDANQRILVNVPRTTGENVRLSLDGGTVARIYSLQLETHDREEIR